MPIYSFYFLFPRFNPKDKSCNQKHDQVLYFLPFQMISADVSIFGNEWMPRLRADHSMKKFVAPIESCS